MPRTYGVPRQNSSLFRAFGVFDRHRQNIKLKTIELRRRLHHPFAAKTSQIVVRGRAGHWVGTACLLRMERQRKLLKPRAHHVQEAPRVVLVLEADYDIIGVTHDDHVAGGLSPPPALWLRDRRRHLVRGAIDSEVHGIGKGPRRQRGERGEHRNRNDFADRESPPGATHLPALAAPSLSSFFLWLPGRVG